MRYKHDMAYCSVMVHRDKQSGATLIILLFLIALLQLLATAAFERSVLDMRIMENRRHWVQAMHAADAGLSLCLRQLEVGSVPVHQWIGQGEPTYWRTPSAFEGSTPSAFEVVRSWPHTVRPPQCLIERWPHPTQSNTFAYLITARGFGATPDAQAWVQSISVLEHAMWRHTWRLVVARPY